MEKASSLPPPSQHSRFGERNNRDTTHKLATGTCAGVKRGYRVDAIKMMAH